MIRVSYFPDRTFLERGVFVQSVNVEFRFQNVSEKARALARAIAQQKNYIVKSVVTESIN